MSFPPSSMPIIPPPPDKGLMNWDVPLDAILTSLTTTQQAAWQNAIDAAAAVGVRAITPVVSSASEIASPSDGQVCYNRTSRAYFRYDGSTTTWVPFLTAGADGQFINTFHGAWTAISYTAGSIVTRSGSSWLATGAATSGQVPGVDSVWTVIAAVGATGASGTAGATGQGVPVGGATGTYLKKTASGDYVTAWGSVVDADVSALPSVTAKATDTAVVHLSGTETITGAKTFSVAPTVPSNSFPEAAVTNLTTDLAAKMPLAGGTLTGPVISQTGTAVTLAYQAMVTGDSANRYVQRADGQLMWGPGNAATDLTLRRAASGVLATDNQLAALQGAQIGAVAPAFGGGVGVLGMTNAATTPNANPSGGGVFYASSGAPTWRDPNGNVWSLAPSPNHNPGDQGLLGWSTYPHLSNTNSALTAGVIYLAKVVLRSAATVTNVLLNVGVAGVTVANAWVGLYDFTGARQGLSADQSTGFQSTGMKTVALTTPYAAAQGSYWVAVLVGSAGTLPQLSGATASTVPAAFANAGCTVSTARFATSGSALTALPATITPASNALSNICLTACLS